MKKMRIIPLTTAAVLASVAGALTMNAKTFTETEIKEFAAVEGIEGAYDNVYIIGKHMFKNVISLNDIMTASRTLGEDEENIIYLRSTTGEWTNAMDGSSLTAPTSFEIKVADYKELEDTEVNSKLEAIKAEIEAANYVESEYLESTYEALQTALAMNEDTNEEKVEKLAALETAVENLEFKNAATLENLKKACEAVVKDDYELLSYNEFKKSYDNAKNMSESTYAEINSKIAALTTIKAALTPVTTDNTALTNLLTEVDTKVEADYTKDTWAEFSRAKAEAETAKTSPLQSVINTAKDNLTKATNALVFEGQAKLDEAKDLTNLTETDYTETTWKNLTDTIKGVIDDESTNAKVKTKTTAINNARAALVTKTADAALTKAIADADKILERVTNSDGSRNEDQQEYNAEKLAKLDEALALEVTATEEKTADVLVNEKAVAINTAISEMKFYSEHLLEAELERQAAFEESDYTPESWAAYKTAFEEANAMIYTKNETVLAKIKELKAAAEDNLVSVGTITEESLANLTAAIDGEYKLDEDGNRTDAKYVESSYNKDPERWAAYKTAFDKALALETQAKNYFDEEVEDAVAPLQSDMIKVIEELDTARAALISNATINTINSKVAEFTALSAKEDEYTKASWAAYKEAVESKYNNEAQAKAVVEKINRAVEALEFANKAKLEELKDVTALTETDYTKASWANLVKAIKGTVDAEGNPTGEDEDTFDEIDIKISIIKDAREALETVAHAEAVKELEALISLGYDNTKYVDADGKYAEAIALPEAGASSLTLEEINAKIEAINTALENLKPANYTTLQNLIKAVEDLVVSDYTEESYNTFMTEYNHIMDTYADTTSTLIQTKINAISTAMAKLTYATVDETELKALVDSLYKTVDEEKVHIYENTDNKKYTEESYAVYTEAKEAAEAFIAEEDATVKYQSRANELVKNLNDAIEGLRRQVSTGTDEEVTN